MEEWRTIEPGVWRPEKPGDRIIGVLVNKEPKNDSSGISAKYYIETDKGMFFIWGSTVLDDRMQYVKLNQRVRVTFDGKTKNKRGQDVNLFTVEVADKYTDERRPEGDTNTYLENPVPFERIDNI